MNFTRYNSAKYYMLSSTISETKKVNMGRSFHKLYVFSLYCIPEANILHVSCNRKIKNIRILKKKLRKWNRNDRADTKNLKWRFLESYLNGALFKRHRILQTCQSPASDSYYYWLFGDLSLEFQMDTFLLNNGWYLRPFFS